MDENRQDKILNFDDITCDITSNDQLSAIVIAWVGLVGILLSLSEGLNRVGPKTVAKLCKDILLICSFSATLWQKNE